jgi:hypothetical protein
MIKENEDGTYRHGQSPSVLERFRDRHLQLLYNSLHAVDLASVLFKLSSHLLDLPVLLALCFVELVSQILEHSSTCGFNLEGLDFVDRLDSVLSLNYLLDLGKQFVSELSNFLAQHGYSPLLFCFQIVCFKGLIAIVSLCRFGLVLPVLLASSAWTCSSGHILPMLGRRRLRTPSSFG